MSAPTITGQEMAESLTGFDQIAVKNRFGKDPFQFGEDEGPTFVRALVFVQKRRDGMSDDDAYDHAMNLPVGALKDAFLEDEPDLSELGGPVPPSGEGSAPSEGTPTS